MFRLGLHEAQGTWREFINRQVEACSDKGMCALEGKGGMCCSVINYSEPHGVRYFAFLRVLFDLYNNLATKHYIVDEETGSFSDHQSSSNSCSQLMIEPGFSPLDLLGCEGQTSSTLS